MATVDSNGLVTAEAIGTAFITATSTDGSHTASCTITVTAAPVAATGVSLDASTMSLSVGGATGTLTATLAPANTTESASWDSSDDTIASVIGGVVTAVKAGTATITVTLGAFTDTCDVTVTQPVTSVSIDATASVVVGNTVTLAASVGPADASDPSVIWDTDDGVVATVLNGVVTGVSAGTATITATAGGISDTCTVTVIPTYTVSFDLNYTGSTGAPASQVIAEGSTAAAPADPVRSGYTFLGWYTGATGSTSFTFSTAITADTPVYAHWAYIVQNFDGTAPTFGMANYNSGAGIVTASDLNAIGTSHAKALLVRNGNYNTVPSLKLTLPGVLNTYSSIKFDYYVMNSGATFKGVYVFASNAAIVSGASFGTTLGANNLLSKIETGNPFAGKGAWNTITVDLTSTTVTEATQLASLTTTTVYMALGQSSANGSYYMIDNIRVVDGSGTEYAVENFDGTGTTTTTTVGNPVNYNAQAAVIDTTVTNFPTVTTNSTGSAMLVMNIGYNAMPTIGSYTLPAALGTYSGLRFNYYLLNADTTGAYSAYKQGLLFASTAAITGTAWSSTVGTAPCVAASSGNAFTSTGSWKSYTFDLTVAATQTALPTATTVFLGLGQSSAKGSIYLIDSIELMP